METGNIKVIEAADNFARINKSLICQLDYKAVGVYCKIMVLGKSWKLNIKGLATHLSLSERKMRELINVLESAGYMRRVSVKDERGKFCGWDYYFYASPVGDEDKTHAGQKSDKTENGLVQKRPSPETDKSETCKENNIILKEITDLNNKETERKERGRFTPPTLEEVRQFIYDEALNVNAETFIDYYTSNGWKVGKNKMKDWKATAKNWSRRETAGGEREKSSAQRERKPNIYEETREVINNIWNEHYDGDDEPFI